MWNSLNNNIRNVDILSELRKIDETENHSVPKHFFCGPWKLDTLDIEFLTCDNDNLTYEHKQNGLDTSKTYL
jgi:hypothetical protein